MIYFLIVAFLGVILIKLIMKHRSNWCQSKLCLNGRTTIVTGANSGIGYETALEFAKRGARVILACRNPKTAEEAREKIIKLTQNKNVIVKTVDMLSLKSVRKFVENVLETEDRLDILVNNAGIVGESQNTSEDGLDETMQTNYFGPFLLTYLLLDLLKSTTPSRIINVSSLLAKYKTKLNPDDLNYYHDRWTTYSNSKLCNILFTKELAQQIYGTGVTTYSVHPGVVDTNIFGFRGLFKIFFDIFKSIYFKTWEEGAQTTLYVALQENIEHLSGEHFDECKLVAPYPKVKVPGLSKKVWNNTIDLLQLR